MDGQTTNILQVVPILADRIASPQFLNQRHRTDFFTSILLCQPTPGVQDRVRHNTLHIPHAMSHKPHHTYHIHTTYHITHTTSHSTSHIPHHTYRITCHITHNTSPSFHRVTSPPDVPHQLKIVGRDRLLQSALQFEELTHRGFVSYAYAYAYAYSYSEFRMRMRIRGFVSVVRPLHSCPPTPATVALPD